MSRILYSNATSTTGKQLAQILGIKGSIEPSGKREKVLIRWGSTKRVPLKPKRAVNKRHAILRATDKLGSLALLKKEHVTVPRVYVLNEALNANFSVLLGRRVHHTQGKDIIICLQHEDVVRALNMPLNKRPDFFTTYIPTQREFRVHVFDEKILKISEKILTEPGEFEVPWIRNYENGYTFRNLKHMGNHMKSQLTSVAICAVEALGLEFGAVDVVMSDDGMFVVLEVNTGPSLGDNSLEAYVSTFAEILGIEPQWPAQEEVDEGELEGML